MATRANATNTMAAMIPAWSPPPPALLLLLLFDEETPVVGS
jgi:hypothetical protein